MHLTSACRVTPVAVAGATYTAFKSLFGDNMWDDLIMKSLYDGFGDYGGVPRKPVHSRKLDLR